jgi:hypothetical protein
MPSHESSPDILAARTRLADLIAEAGGELSDRDLAVLELSYRHGLEGAELAEALEVSIAQARALSHRLRQTIERSLGALLIARRVRRNPGACPDLAGTLSGWDGDFTARIRRRVAGHVDGCPVCEAARRRLVTPAALFGAAPVFIPAPDWLRTQTLRCIRLADRQGRPVRARNRSVMRRCYDAAMRTTVDLPEDLHRQVRAIARDTHRTFSDTVADLMRRGLHSDAAAALSRSPRTGLPVVTLGTVVTTEDIRSLDDQE